MRFTFDDATRVRQQGSGWDFRKNWDSTWFNHQLLGKDRGFCWNIPWRSSQSKILLGKIKDSPKVDGSRHVWNLGVMNIYLYLLYLLRVNCNSSLWNSSGFGKSFPSFPIPTSIPIFFHSEIAAKIRLWALLTFGSIAPATDPPFSEAVCERFTLW